MKEWYMTNYSPNNCGGYESDALNDYAQENFTDVLHTTFSDTVLLYDSSLELHKKVKCVVQGSVSDTQLKSIERTILFPIGTVNTGMYVFFEDCYWIIDGYPGNNKSYEKATVKLCQYDLTWQLSNGEIVHRWVNIMSASKYDVGESGNNTIILTSNNYTVLIGYDEKSSELEGKRVFIDKKKVKPNKVFKFTRNDDVLYDYSSHGSLLSFIADKTEFNPDNDNQELKICDYHSPAAPPEQPAPPDETEVLSAVINGNPEIKLGLPRTYTVTFTDKNGVEMSDVEFSWNVVSGFAVEQVVDGNSIELFVEDDSLIGKSFILQILVNDKAISELEIVITDF